MQTLAFPLDPTEVNPFFFSAQFKHKESLYRIGVAEVLFGDGDSTGRYAVLAVNEAQTINFEMFKDEEENWSVDARSVSQELLYIIGQEIDKKIAGALAGFEYKGTDV